MEKQIKQADQIRVGDTLTTEIQTSVVTKIENGEIMVEDGQHVIIEQVQDLMDRGILTASREQEDTSREVTFMNVTTTINPLQDRLELEENLSKGLITPLAFYHGCKAHWNNMNNQEKEIEFAELN